MLIDRCKPVDVALVLVVLHVELLAHLPADRVDIQILLATLSPLAHTNHKKPKFPNTKHNQIDFRNCKESLQWSMVASVSCRASWPSCVCLLLSCKKTNKNMCHIFRCLCFGSCSTFWCPSLSSEYPKCASNLPLVNQ